jgi:hypothetical protein
MYITGLYYNNWLASIKLLLIREHFIFAAGAEVTGGIPSSIKMLK